MIGDSDCGKTTLLYQMKLRKLVDTIPTVGFNVETVEYPGKYQWTIWDMTMSRRLPEQLIHTYFLDPDLVLLIHNCDPQQLEPIYDHHYFVDFLHKHGCRNVWILFNKQDMLPPETVTEVVDGLRKKYEKEMAKHEHQLSWKIFDHKLSAKTGEGVQEILDHLHTSARLFLRTRPRPQPATEPALEPYHKPTLDSKIPEHIVSSPGLSKPIDEQPLRDSVGAQAFWDSFVTGHIPVWDHHVHLKVTYIIVLEYMKRRRSTFAMADTMLAHLERLRNSQPEKFGHRIHRTITIFWILQLQIAIRDYRIKTNCGADPLWIDFHNILFSTPSVMDPRLWRLYYSTEHLFSPRAWDSWTPPNRQPLPVLTPLLDQPASLSTVEDDPARLIRFAFVFIRQHRHISESFDEAVICQALTTLQSTTIRLRATKIVVSPYSETQARFWLCLVRACLQSLEIPRAGGRGILPSQLNFDHFIVLFRLTPTSWRAYYSQKVWDSLTARVQFVPPNRRALPDILNVSARHHEVEAVIKRIEKEALDPGEELLEDVLLTTPAENVEPCWNAEERVDVDAFLSCEEDHLNHHTGDFDDKRVWHESNRTI